MRKSIAAVLLAPFLLAQLAFVKAYEPGYVVPRGSDGDDTPGGHDLDASGAVIISMNIANPSSFISNRTLTRQVSGCQTVNSAAACGGSSDIVLVKTNRAGESLWNTSFGTAGADISHSVASGAEGYYVTGAADGQAFLAKVAKSDGRMDVFQVISAAGTIPTDVKVHPQNGDVFVAGYTTAGIDGCFAQGWLIRSDPLFAPNQTDLNSLLRHRNTRLGSFPVSLQPHNPDPHLLHPPGLLRGLHHNHAARRLHRL
jgi:hypothetical protein